jgi:membrane-bound ClpP family serine protease
MSLSADANFEQPKEAYGADTQVDTLEVLSTVDVQTSVDNTTLLSRLHRASTERVPSCLNVIGDPVVDGLVVLLGVLDVFVDLVSIVGLRWTVPGTFLLA